MKTRRKKQEIALFRRYILSDLVLILLILLTMLPFVFNTLYAMNERAQENLSAVVTRTLEDIDAMLSNLESTLPFYGNEALTALYTLNRSANGKDYYTMRKASQSLCPIILANPLLHDILIGYPESEIFLRAGSGFDSRQGFDSYYGNKGFFDEAFQKRKTSFFLPSRTMEFGSPVLREEVFGYVLGLRNYALMRVCILIKTEECFSAAIRKAIDDAGYAALTDDNGMLIKEIGVSGGSYRSLSTLPDARHFVNVECTSKSGRLTICARTPSMVPSSAMANIVLLLLTCLTAALVTGTVYSTLTARQHTKPVKRLISQIGQYSTQLRSGESKMSAMQVLLDTLKRENMEFAEQVEDYRRSRYDNVITRLFTASFISEEDMRCLHTNFGELPARYAVAYGRLGGVAVADESRDAVSVLSFDILKTKLPPGCLVYMAGPMRIAVLFNAAPEIEQENRDRIRQAEAVAEVAWTFSSVYEGAALVSMALEEARMRRQRNDKKESSITLQGFQHIYHCMLAGDAEQSKEQIDRLFLEASAENIRYLYDGICFIAYLAAHETEWPCALPPYDGRESFTHLKSIACDVIDRFCETLNVQKKSRNETRKKKVLEYIQANFTDSGMYAASIAEYAGISEKYLYNFVKEQTGFSVGEYLQNLRMTRASEILLQGKMPVKEVCYAVGFNSENSFYKAFKRAFGVTPSQYRISGRTTAQSKKM